MILSSFTTLIFRCKNSGVTESGGRKNKGVAETRYEFKCRDVPWKVSTRVWISSKIIFIHQISNAELSLQACIYSDSVTPESLQQYPVSVKLSVLRPEI
jgi:hypothetical protein